MTTCNVSRAAELLCIHRDTVCDLIADGALPAAKIGRSYVMLEKDILDYLDAQIIRQTKERMGRNRESH